MHTDGNLDDSINLTLWWNIMELQYITCTATCISGGFKLIILL